MNFKIIIGLALAGLSTVQTFGGNLEPTWVSVHRYPIPMTKSSEHKIYPYRGAIDGYVFHGQYSSSIYNLTKGYLKKKIVITQKTPCYVVPKNWDKGTNGYGGLAQRKDRKTIRINASTIEVYKPSNGGTQTTKIGANFRIKSSKDTRIKDAIVLLGSSKQCLKKPNQETWKVYWELKGNWVLMAQESFSLKGN